MREITTFCRMLTLLYKVLSSYLPYKTNILLLTLNIDIDLLYLTASYMRSTLFCTSDMQSPNIMSPFTHRWHLNYGAPSPSKYGQLSLWQLLNNGQSKQPFTYKVDFS